MKTWERKCTITDIKRPDRQNPFSSFLFRCLWHEVLTGKWTAFVLLLFRLHIMAVVSPAELSQELEKKPIADGRHGPSQEGANLLCPEGVGAWRHTGQQRILNCVLNAELLKLCGRLRNLYSVDACFEAQLLNDFLHRNDAWWARHVVWGYFQTMCNSEDKSCK